MYCRILSALPILRRRGGAVLRKRRNLLLQQSRQSLWRDDLRRLLKNLCLRRQIRAPYATFSESRNGSSTPMCRDYRLFSAQAPANRTRKKSLNPLNWWTRTSRYQNRKSYGRNRDRLYDLSRKAR